MVELFFLILATVVFNFFRKKAPPSMFICVPERPMLPVKKKRNKLLYNFTQLCIILKMLPYVCFLFHCWVNLFSGGFRQVFFHLGDKKLVASYVRQVVILCSNDCMGICLVGLSIGCLR